MVGVVVLSAAVHARTCLAARIRRAWKSRARPGESAVPDSGRVELGHQLAVSRMRGCQLLLGQVKPVVGTDQNDIPGLPGELTAGPPGGTSPGSPGDTPGMAVIDGAGRTRTGGSGRS